MQAFALKFQIIWQQNFEKFPVKEEWIASTETRDKDKILRSLWHSHLKKY